MIKNSNTVNHLNKYIKNSIIDLKEFKNSQFKHGLNLNKVSQEQNGELVIISIQMLFPQILVNLVTEL